MVLCRTRSTSGFATKLGARALKGTGLSPDYDCIEEVSEECAAMLDDIRVLRRAAREQAIRAQRDALTARSSRGPAVERRPGMNE